MILTIVGILLIFLCLVDALNVHYSKANKLIYCLSGSYKAQLAVQAMLFMLGVVLIVISRGFGINIVFLVLVAILYYLLLRVEIKPDGLIRLFRGKKADEAIQTDLPHHAPVAWQERYTLEENIRYNSAYPNNFCDLYTKLGEKRPVFVYAHGGGYIFGDKSNGDPNALGISGIIRIVRQLLDAGFAVVSTDYVFGPEYRYPAAVVQMNELLAYLKENAVGLGLDMTRVVLGGGSAGGQLMAQVACLHTNPAYAAEMGITPALKPGVIRAVYHGCALLDNERFGRTGSRATDYVFYQMGRAYFGCNVLEGNEQVRQSNVITHVTEDYPASFIRDGNIGTFNAQAHNLADRLAGLGVKTKVLIFDEPGAKRLPHGFDTLEHQRGYRSTKEMVSFVKNEVFSHE